MQLEIVSFHEIQNEIHSSAKAKVTRALLENGIVGISDVPQFIEKSHAYIRAARDFCALNDSIKQQYAPRRDEGDTEGYELGAEWFKDQNDEWQIDDKKASYYAHVPDQPQNKWPREVDLKTPYLALGELIFATGKRLLNFIGLNETVGLPHAKLRGYGRLLHYHKENQSTNFNPNWCGAHFDHGVFTGLMPAHYFQDGVEVEEPEEAGLYIKPTNGNEFEKIAARDKSILLFQVGEFGQLASHDAIRATNHLVKKAKNHIERYAFAIFYDAHDCIIHSHSELARDSRYTDNMTADGKISYDKWSSASFARYRVS